MASKNNATTKSLASLIKMGNTRVLLKTLQDVKDLNFRIKQEDHSDLTPLLMAISNENVKTVKILIENGANVNFSVESPPLIPPLMYAILTCSQNSLLVISALLLENGADPNQVFTINTALRTPIHLAIRRKSLKLIDLLLKHGASLEMTNENLLSPLFYALGCRNSLDVVRGLLERGANPNHHSPFFLNSFQNVTCLRYQRMASPLHFAISYLNIDKIKVLLDHGADPNCTWNDCISPLSFALLYFTGDDVQAMLDFPKNVIIVELLLSHGADSNQRSWFDGSYLTPLVHYLRKSTATISSQLVHLIVNSGKARVYLLDDHPLGILPLNLEAIHPSLLHFLLEVSQEYKPSLLQGILHHYRDSPECVSLLKAKISTILSLKTLSLQKIRQVLHKCSPVYDQLVGQLDLPTVLKGQILGTD